MNGKTAKLLRQVARTNPYGVENIDESHTLYGRSKDKTSIVVAPGFRLTYQYLKKFYEAGMFTTDDLRQELAHAKKRKAVEKIVGKKPKKRGPKLNAVAEAVAVATN